MKKHQRGSRVYFYLLTPVCVRTSHQERFPELKSKKLWFQCLLPGVDCTKGKHKDYLCQAQSSHEIQSNKKHIVVSDEKNNQENRDLLEHYS